MQEPFENDHELIEAFRRKDKEAVSTIFRLYYPQLVRFSGKLINNKTAAQDIVMNVFVRLLKNNYQNLENKANLKAYLLTAVRNESYNYLKAEENLQEKNTKLIAHLTYLERDQSSPAYDYDLMETSILQSISEQVGKLPPQSRKIFLLKTIKQYSNKEIAVLLNLNEKTVRNQWSIAIQKLKLAAINGEIVNPFLLLFSMFLYL